MSNYQTKYKTEVKRLIDKIRDDYQPEKIIIFGSFANRKITRDSDVDFFIIKKTRKNRRERQQEVSRLLIDRQIPLDILVYTPEEAKKRERLGDFFIKDILQKGKLVYAK